MSWNVCNWTAENKRSKWCPKALGWFIASPTRSGNNSYQGSAGCSLPKPLIAETNFSCWFHVVVEFRGAGCFELHAADWDLADLGTCLLLLHRILSGSTFSPCSSPANTSVFA